jgi:hypothetical protein
MHKLHNKRLDCFEPFKNEEQGPFSLIRALITTCSLRATNPRDHIYAVLGIAGMPAKAMSLETWMKTRTSYPMIFLPIDYRADLCSIFTS